MGTALWGPVCWAPAGSPPSPPPSRSTARAASRAVPALSGPGPQALQGVDSSVAEIWRRRKRASSCTRTATCCPGRAATTVQSNGLAKGWNAGAPMDDGNFNRRQTIRVGAAVACAQVGAIGFDRSIDLQSLRLYRLPSAMPTALNGTPLLPGGAAEPNDTKPLAARVVA
jgi:hypothetical protein